MSCNSNITNYVHIRSLHGTKLNEVMGYRCHDENTKSDFKKIMARMKEARDLEADLTEGERAAVEKFNREFE